MSGNSWSTIRSIYSPVRLSRTAPHRRQVRRSPYPQIAFCGDSRVPSLRTRQNIDPTLSAAPRRLHPVLPIPDPTTVIQGFLATPCPCRYSPSRAVGLNKVNECVSGATAKKYKCAIVSGSIPFGVRNFFHKNRFFRQHSAQNTRAIMEIALLN